MYSIITKTSYIYKFVDSIKSLWFDVYEFPAHVSREVTREKIQTLANKYDIDIPEIDEYLTYMDTHGVCYDYMIGPESIKEQIIFIKGHYINYLVYMLIVKYDISLFKPDNDDSALITKTDPVWLPCVDEVFKVNGSPANYISLNDKHAECKQAANNHNMPELNNIDDVIIYARSLVLSYNVQLMSGSDSYHNLFNEEDNYQESDTSSFEYSSSSDDCFYE